MINPARASSPASRATSSAVPTIATDAVRGVIRTRFTEMFALRHPIMGAPMAMHSGGTLAAAVAAAGGMGSFGGLNAGGPEWVRAQAALVRDLTDRPFAIGFITPFLSFQEDSSGIGLRQPGRTVRLRLGGCVVPALDIDVRLCNVYMS